METFSLLLALCEGNPLVTDGFPSQRPVTRSFDVFFDLRLNKRLSYQSRRRWYETPSRHYDVTVIQNDLWQRDRVSQWLGFTSSDTITSDWHTAAFIVTPVNLLLRVRSGYIHSRCSPGWVQSLYQSSLFWHGKNLYILRLHIVLYKKYKRLMFR